MDKQSQIIAEMDKQMEKIEKYEKLLYSPHISTPARIAYKKKVIAAQKAYNELAAAYIKETK